MLPPKKQKFKKVHKGRVAFKSKAGTTLAFGEYGLKSLDALRVETKHFEAARRAAIRHMKRQGMLWFRVNVDVPVTNKPTEVRMGKGKGGVEYYAARISPGRIILEIAGVTEEVALRALELASGKFPVKTKIVKRVVEDKYDE